MKMIGTDGLRRAQNTGRSAVGRDTGESGQEEGRGRSHLVRQPILTGLRSLDCSSSSRLCKDQELADPDQLQREMYT